MCGGYIKVMAASFFHDKIINSNIIALETAQSLLPFFAEWLIIFQSFFYFSYFQKKFLFILSVYMSNHEKIREERKMDSWEGKRKE